VKRLVTLTILCACLGFGVGLVAGFSMTRSGPVTDAQLQEELDDLRKDKARLDWFEKNIGATIPGAARMSLRQAIDWKMRGEMPQPTRRQSKPPESGKPTG